METFTWKSLIKGTINRIFDGKVSFTEKGAVTETNFCHRKKFMSFKQVFVQTKIYVNKIMFYRKQVSITEKSFGQSFCQRNTYLLQKKICHRFFFCHGQKFLSKKEEKNPSS